MRRLRARQDADITYNFPQTVGKSEGARCGGGSDDDGDDGSSSGDDDAVIWGSRCFRSTRRVLFCQMMHFIIY